MLRVHRRPRSARSLDDLHASHAAIRRIGAPGLWGARLAAAGVRAEPVTILPRVHGFDALRHTAMETNLRVLIADEDEGRSKPSATSLEGLGHEVMPFAVSVQKRPS